MIGDEVVGAEKQVEFRRGEAGVRGVMDGVGDEIEVVVVIFQLGDGAVADAVFDRERVEAEEFFQDGRDFVRGGLVEVDPKHDAGLLPQGGEGFDGRIVPGELGVAINEGGDHGARLQIQRRCLHHHQVSAVRTRVTPMAPG